MEEITYQKSYQEFKEELRGELQRTTESFVRIGYLLKVARDTDILKTSGYENLEDFARGEFDLDKTQVSRFIRINDRFSEGGNSDRLMTSYADFGVRKLGLMLTLPAEINEELTPDYTVGEIESIKKTYDEEQAVTPIEDYMERTEAKAENNRAAEIAENDPLSAVIYQIGHDEPEVFKQMFESEDLLGDIDLFSVLAPGGESTHKVRIKGVGALLMVCAENDITITNLRSLGKSTYTWSDANAAFDTLLDTNCPTEQNAKAAWRQVYGEPYPEDIAKEKQEPGPEKKPSKIIDHIKPEKKEPQTAKTLVEEAVSDKKLSTTPQTAEILNAEASAETKTEIAPEEQKEENETEHRTDETEHRTDETEHRTDETEHRTDESETKPEAAAIEEQKTPEQVFSAIERSLDEARKIADYISNTLSYDAEELCADDIREVLERHNRLKMHLEMMKAGYDEYEDMKDLK